MVRLGPGSGHIPTMVSKQHIAAVGCSVDPLGLLKPFPGEGEGFCLAPSSATATPNQFFLLATMITLSTTGSLPAPGLQVKNPTLGPQVHIYMLNWFSACPPSSLSLLTAFPCVGFIYYFY